MSKYILNILSAQTIMAAPLAGNNPNVSNIATTGSTFFKGYPCTISHANTEMFDASGKYNKITVCTASSDRLTVKMFEEIGAQENKKRLEVISIKKNHSVSTQRFCAPDYADLN